MAITINIKTGVVDLGDTKELEITPKDSAGDAFDATELTAVFTSQSGNATTYTHDGAGGTETIPAPSSSVYTINHTFEELGEWSIGVTATDVNGNVEVETGKVLVQ